MGERTLVHLLRHGEVHNPDKVLYGRLPGFQLSERGVAMAHAAAEWLRDRDVVHLRSSPLERAQATAAPLAATFGLTPELDDRLLESTNRFEGMTVEPFGGAFKDPSTWAWLWNPLRPSWGEPYAEVATRMLAAAASARDAARGHEAVCVSHQLPIWTARRAAEGRRLWHRPDRRQCALCSITTLVYDDDRLTAVRYAQPPGTSTPGEEGPPGA